MRTDSRRDKVVVRHQNSGVRVASLKTMRCETGSQWNFFKRDVISSFVSYGRSVGQRGFVFLQSD